MPSWGNYSLQYTTKEGCCAAKQGSFSLARTSITPISRYSKSHANLRRRIAAVFMGQTWCEWDWFFVHTLWLIETYATLLARYSPPGHRTSRAAHETISGRRGGRWPLSLHRASPENLLDNSRSCCTHLGPAGGSLQNLGANFGFAKTRR